MISRSSTQSLSVYGVYAEIQDGGLFNVRLDIL